ncbi:quinoprotein relay system zinc metallohydrolase 2 [Terrihabitans sp. B22-R8]|uniref:quinoprotein relay system zinc metallohydrolase 2 n=1 Tax=Terrihabitans sp. B22-R8 TaxID=3425128 RepID=UPI00403C9AEA
MALGRGNSASRRDLLLAGLCLCCLPRAGFAARSARIEEIAPGIFIRRGVDEDASPGNVNAIANTGFIIGRDAVLVTDPGGSLADGRWLRARIRERTEKPIRHVVLSHVHPDHCFGAGAFVEDAPDVIAHAGFRPALETRGPFYREKLSELIGEDPGPLVLPTREIGPEGGTLDLGDRTLTFHAHGKAHSDCDLSMMDRTAGLLFPADLLFVGRVPSLDGSLPGWLRELDRLETLGAKTIVPGHGPVTVGPDAFHDVRRYLTLLRDETRTAIRQGRSIERAIATIADSEKRNWTLFEDYNGRNITQAFKELEWE